MYKTGMTLVKRNVHGAHGLCELRSGYTAPSFFYLFQRRYLPSQAFDKPGGAHAIKIGELPDQFGCFFDECLVRHGGAIDARMVNSRQRKSEAKMRALFVIAIGLRQGFF